MKMVGHGRRWMISLLVLTSLIAGLTAAPLARARIAAPAPAVQDEPLDAAAAAEFVAMLNAEVRNVLNDELDLAGVNSEFARISGEFGRRGAMTGRTKRQIVDLYLGDIRRMIEDKSVLDGMAAAFAAILSMNPTRGGASGVGSSTVNSPQPADTGVTTPGIVAGTTNAGGANNAAALREYIRGLNYDPRILLSETSGAGTVTPLPPSRSLGPGSVVVCTSTPVNEKENLDEITVLNPSEAIIYPGALVYGDESLRDGQPRPITALSRRPISLRLDLPGLGREGSFVIDDPKYGTYQGRLNEVLRAWSNGPAYEEGYVNAARSTYNVENLYSSTQIGFDLNVNARWSGGTAGVDATFKQDTQKRVVVAMFKQVFYTVTYDQPNAPEEAFDPSVTVAEARQEFSGPDKPPAYVSSVNYGRIILVRMETDKSVTNVDAKAAFEYGKGQTTGVDVKARAKYDQILQNSKMTVVTLGGGAENAVQAISVRKPGDLDPIIKGKNAVYSKENPGVPIAYTVRYLKDNQVAKLQFSNNYNREDCKQLKNFTVKLQHSGAYVADFSLTWTEPGQRGGEVQNGKTVGWAKTYIIPGDATNIILEAKTHTGLVWEPRREILKRELTPAMLKDPLCIKVTGTTLGPAWDTTCSF